MGERGLVIEFPASAELRDLIRLRRKRAAERPALEKFKRQRMEALRRLTERRGGKTAG